MLADPKHYVSSCKQVHTELQEHGQTLQLFLKAEAADCEGLVAKHRLQLTAKFFGHVENLIHAAHQDEAQREGIDLLTSWLSSAYVAICCLCVHAPYVSSHLQTVYCLPLCHCTTAALT